ncbi:MAG: BlaI/MecI/CopY family transcriptional regulator [Acidimicrobiales bacterium]
MARLAMGELEGAVMDMLWDRGGWLTPGEVRKVLAADHPVAYTTVMTILVRLWRKQRVERRRDGRAFAYRPTQGREEYAAEKMRELLADAADRPAALAYFLKSLTRSDRAELRKMLRGRERPT